VEKGGKGTQSFPIGKVTFQGLHNHFLRDGNGETNIFEIKICFIIQLKQPFINGWLSDIRFKVIKVTQNFRSKWSLFSGKKTCVS